jgi:putative ABC transport system permease protein
MSEKYFGKATSPLGKTLSIAGGWLPGDFQVTAVIEDVPDNTHFNFSFLLPLHKLLRENEQYKEDDGWQWSNFVTYVQLHASADLATVHDKE